MNTVIKNPIIFGTPIATTLNMETKMETIANLIELTNLNDTYVIVKRYDGAVYFKRVGLVTDVKSYPKKNCLYYKKIEADEECIKLNSNRRKCKYVVENASKYFVNMYTYNHWYGTNAQIKNYAVAIKDFQSGNIKTGDFKTLEEAIYAAKDSIGATKRTKAERQRYIEKELPKDIDALRKRAAEQTYQLQKEIDADSIRLDSINTENLEKYKSYETQGDKMTRLLYGKSTPTNKSTTDTNTGIG